MKYIITVAALILIFSFGNTEKQPKYLLIGISIQNNETTRFENGYFTMYDFREDSLIATIRRAHKDEINGIKNIVITGIYEFKSKKEMDLFRNK